MMRPMRSSALAAMTTGVVAVVALLFAAPRTADAAKPKKKYFFELAEVKAADSLGQAGKDLEPVTQAQVAKSIAAHEQIVVTLDGAPDRANAKAFKAYLKKKKLAGAFRVNVEL